MTELLKKTLENKQCYTIKLLSDHRIGNLASPKQYALDDNPVTTAYTQKHCFNNHPTSQSMVYSRTRYSNQALSTQIKALDLAASATRIKITHASVMLQYVPTSNITDTLLAILPDIILTWKSQYSAKTLLKQHPYLDIIDFNPASSLLSRQMVLRYWFTNANNIHNPHHTEKEHTEKNSKIIVVSINEHNAPDCIDIYTGIFGNVDVIQLPNTIHKQDELKYTVHKNIDEANFSIKQLVGIMQYLDHGQSFNMSTIYGLMNKDATFQPSNESCKPYLHYFEYYQKTAPNGNLLVQPLPTHIKILHQTAYKGEIVKSGQLNVSKTGCLGNSVYGTTLVSPEKNIMGGHAISLYRRAHNDTEVSDNQFLLISVDQPLNNIYTNWIERFGFGRLYLEASLRLSNQSPRENNSKMSKVLKNCLQAYCDSYRLLDYMHRYGRSKRKTNIAESDWTNFWKTFEETRKKSPSITNNIFFEIIKDYILLYQNDKVSKKFLELGSFNMDLQYKIIFNLAPEMKKRWDTSLFAPTWEEIIKVFSNFNLPFQDENLKKFILDRLSYYINVRCLEGADSILHPAYATSFDSLAAHIPNFSGYLIHGFLAKFYLHTQFFDDYLQHLAHCYAQSYRARNICFPIKSGSFRTEEVAVLENVTTSIHAVSFNKKGSDIYGVVQGEQLPVTISKSASSFNGFTTRTLQKEQTIKLAATSANIASFFGKKSDNRQSCDFPKESRINFGRKSQTAE